VKSPLGGDFISSQCKSFLEDSSIEIVPPYMIASKEQVWENEKAKFVKKVFPEVTKSWHNYMTKVGYVVENENILLLGLMRIINF